MWNNLLIAIFLCLALRLNAATYTAASTAQRDVADAIARTRDGDTVIVPAGSSTWRTNITVKNCITIQGAGTNATIITEEVAHTYPGQVPLFTLYPTLTNQLIRITGFQFVHGTNTTGGAQAGIIQVVGNTKKWRVDHCFFNYIAGQVLIAYGWTYGVIDHCTVHTTNQTSIVVHHGSWGGGAYGDGSWASASTWGTIAQIYIEDCYLKGGGSGTAFTDGYNGARFTVRYCTIMDGHLDSHEGGSRTRATRQVEVYHNNFISTRGGGLATYLRGGSTLVWSNKLDANFTVLTVVANYRSVANYPTWGGASGTNIWDNNAPTAAATGTYTGANGATTVLVDTNASWTDNQFVGYALQNTTAGATNSFGQRFGVVLRNTSNTITTFPAVFSNDQLRWMNGNTYALYFITNGLDQVGMGK